MPDCKILLNLNCLKVFKFFISKREEYSVRYNNIFFDNHGFLIKNMIIEEFIKNRSVNTQLDLNMNDFLNNDKQYQYLILYRNLKNVVYQVIVSDFKEQCFIHIDFNKLDLNQNKELDSNHFLSNYNDENFKLYYVSKLNFQLIDIPFILHTIILGKNLITDMFNCHNIYDLQKHSNSLYPVGFLLYRWLLLNKNGNPDTQVLFTEEPILKQVDKFNFPLPGQNFNKEIIIGFIDFQIEKNIQTLDKNKDKNNKSISDDENDNYDFYSTSSIKKFSRYQYVYIKNMNFQMRQYLSLMLDSKAVL
jgi:hypothetical protein